MTKGTQHLRPCKSGERTKEVKGSQVKKVTADLDGNDQEFWSSSDSKTKLQRRALGQLTFGGDAISFLYRSWKYPHLFCIAQWILSIMFILMLIIKDTPAGNEGSM